MNEKLTKDPSLLNVLEELRRVFGPDAFSIVDHWSEDMLAIGIARPADQRYLVYLSVLEEAEYYADLEAPSDPDDDFPYKEFGSYSGLSFDQLTSVVSRHLLIEPTSERTE